MDSGQQRARTMPAGQASGAGPGTAPHPRPGFRPDIEGLRAVAVLPILFNHALVRGFGGGFIGVDIFFVISGYLITGILLRDVAAGRYSIAGFYRRRVLRIFPALFAMLAVTSAVALIAMTPSELRTYARSLLATVFFASNVQFYADTGYFAAAASTRPLLHTWSLAVEEQFYIVWPLLLAWAARRGGRAVPAVIVSATLASFALGAWMVTRDMSAAFYLIPFRAWELGVGGLLALWRSGQAPPRWLREGAALAALVTIALCVRFYREPLVFPGWTALPPCLATVALIAAGPDTLVGRALSWRIVRFFGLISYSLYLWHWPVIVFARLWLFLPSSAPVIAGELAVSVLLACASYRWIETGLRRPMEGMATRRVLLGGGGAIAVATLAGVGVLIGQGLPGRFSREANALARVLDRDQEAAYRKGTCFVVEAGDRFDPRCLERRGTGPTLLLVGDSTAAHLWPGLAIHAADKDVRQATMIGCTPELVGWMTERPCGRFWREMLTGWAPSHRPDAILLAGNWQPEDVGQLGPTLDRLRRAGQRVIVVGPMPRYDSSLPRLLLFGQAPDRLARARGAFDRSVPELDRGLRAAALANGAAYVSPYALLCPHGRCRLFAWPGLPIQFDQVHLTTEGSKVAVGLMMPGIDRALARWRTASAGLSPGG